MHEEFSTVSVCAARTSGHLKWGNGLNKQWSIQAKECSVATKKRKKGLHDDTVAGTL